MSKSKYLILLNSLWFYHKKTSIKNTNIHIHFHYIYIFSFFSFYIHICTLQIIKIQKPNKQYIEQLEIYKINPKKFKKKKVLGSPLRLQKRGGTSPPRATATGGVWVHTPPQENPGKQGGLKRRPPFFPSSPAVTCKTLKNATKSWF